MDALRYASFQGRILLGERRSDGKPPLLRWVGDNSSAEFSFSPNVQRYRENWTGNRTTALTMTEELTASLNTTLLQINNRNLQLLLQGDEHNQDTDAVTGHVIADTLPVAGDIVLLGAFDLTNVVITDSSVTPKTLELGTNYLLNAKAGQIEILDMDTDGPFVAPLKAAFTPGEIKYVKMLTTSEKEWWLRVEGKNTAVAGHPQCIVDFYRWKSAPTTGMPMINPQRLEAQVQGELMIDDTKAVDDEFGQFGRMVLL